MDNPASVSDIVSRWRPLKSDENDVATTRLDDAWRLIRRKVPTLAARLDVGADPDLLAETVRVLADAVIRVLERRERKGLRRKSVEVVDGSSTVEYDDGAGDSARGLYFTDDELDALSPTPAGSAGGAFSVMPS